MTSPELSKHLQLSVTNLGPIAKADIELRPMTVFVGPSNTGKSYLAILIYALHRFFSGRASRPRQWPYFGTQTIFDLGPTSPAIKEFPRDELESLTEWLEHTLRSAEDNPGEEEDIDAILPESVAKLVRPVLNDVSEFGQVLDAEIMRCFGLEDTASLVRNRTANGSRVDLGRAVADAEDPSISLGYSFAMRRNQHEFSPLVPSGPPLRLLVKPGWRDYTLNELYSLIDVIDNEAEEEITYMASRLLANLSESVGKGMVTPFDSAAHYLPAGRTGVMHAHRVVVGSLIGQAARAGFERDTPLPRLSGVLADFLEQLIGLEEPKVRGARRRRESLAEQIESEILQGEIRMARSPVGYPEFLYRPEGWKEDLGLMNTSSMVSELAPVVLYLRYVVRPGETLIIEEPESHLHPALQVEFTRHLAAAVRAGVRVIITTHSEWVLEELANLVRLSDLPEAQRKGIGGGDYGLTRDQLGVWRFEPKKRPKGSVVREIPFNSDIGNFDSGFDRVAMATYNDQAEIIRREERLKTNAGRH